MRPLGRATAAGTYQIADHTHASAGTLAVGVLTWNGMASLFTTAGSMLATYAMFYMRGAVLRVAMVGVAALWMYNAWAYDSWWQMFGYAVIGGAAAYGAWRATKAAATA